MSATSQSPPFAENEIEIRQIRAQGPGGQNVNKVASAVQLRFDIGNSSLPDSLKQRLLATSDSRITGDGVIVITAQNHRSYIKNKEDALRRLAALIRSVSITRKKRKATRPSKTAKRKRLDRKINRGRLKKTRKKVSE